jgi:uncharacterized protein (DUF1501 family)
MTTLPPHEQARTRALTRHAQTVQADLCAQEESWRKGGFTRRRFIAGAGMVGAAALANQLVTTRVAYAAKAADVTTENTLIVVFMRGAADGLRMLVPNTSDLGLNLLRDVRPTLLPASANLIPLPGAGGWGLNTALKPLYDTLWATGEFALVPAVSTPGVSRSHFQAQQYLERGGSDTSTTGWLDRLLDELGPGTTFRAVADGSSAPVSLVGPENFVGMNGVQNFRLGSWDGIVPQRRAALTALYRGLDTPLGEDVPITLSALDTAAVIRSQAGVRNGAVYPGGSFSTSLQDLAAILRADVGMQVATVDVGGWDTHTGEATDLDNNLSTFAKSLAAFMTDLGPDRRKRVTVVVQTEFGRRVAANGSGGSDHGHGSVMMLLGGGLRGSGVYGTWLPLLAGILDQGDVPGLNSPFSVLSEVIQKRLNVGLFNNVFPGQIVLPIGIATAS